MMGHISRSTVFILSFFIMLTGQETAAERVQLGEVSLDSKTLKYSSDLLEEPRGCILQIELESKPCSFRVGRRRKLTLESESRNLTVGDNTILVRESKNRYRLVEGFIRIQAEATTTVVVSSASDLKKSVRVQGDGEFFIEKYGSDVVVVNTGAKKVSIHTAGRDLGWIGTGMEIRFNKPDRYSGSYEIGPPLPLDLESQIVREAKFHIGLKSEFGQRIDVILAMQRRAAELTASIHSQTVARKIASLEEEAERRRKEKARREAEDREIRALFRRKVLMVE
jgi:hypothetical protein